MQHDYFPNQKSYQRRSYHTKWWDNKRIILSNSSKRHKVARNSRRSTRFPRGEQRKLHSNEVKCFGLHCKYSQHSRYSRWCSDLLWINHKLHRSDIWGNTYSFQWWKRSEDKCWDLTELLSFDSQYDNGGALICINYFVAY